MIVHFYFVIFEDITYSIILVFKSVFIGLLFLSIWIYIVFCQKSNFICLFEQAQEPFFTLNTFPELVKSSYRHLAPVNILWMGWLKI